MKKQQAMFSSSWSNVPLDLLSSIAARLYTPDYACFRCVCASWRSAATSAAPLSPLMPFLLSSDDVTGSSSLLNLADARIQRLPPLPELTGSWLVGSQHGWLIALDPLSNLSLINPFTRSQIHLPSITTLPFIEPIFDPADGSLSKYRFHRDQIWSGIPEPVVDHTLDAFRRLSFRKVALSSPPTEGRRRDFAVAAILHMWKLVVFLSPGEDKWSLLDHEQWFGDIIFRPGGIDGQKVLTAVSEINGEVFSLNRSWYDDPAELVHPSVIRDRGGFSARYLVDLDGDLLQISRDSEFVGGRFGRNMSVTVVMVRWDANLATWRRVTSLGHHSLFVGNSYSLALSARDIPGLKPNCIYFTDDAWEEFFMDEEIEMVRNVGVYNVEDGSVERLDFHGVQLKWPPPVWFTPNLQNQN